MQHLRKLASAIINAGAMEDYIKKDLNHSPAGVTNNLPDTVPTSKEREESESPITYNNSMEFSVTPSAEYMD